MDYESCDVYKIKGADGMCTGGDEQCNECPCFIKNTKVCEEEKIEGPAKNRKGGMVQ